MMLKKCSSTTSTNSSRRKSSKVPNVENVDQEGEQAPIARFKEASKSSNFKAKKEKTLKAVPINDIDDYAAYKLARDRLHKLKDPRLKNYSFLTNVLDEITMHEYVPVEASKPTDIDIQLSALLKRIELNQTLLERTNERAKGIDFTVEKSRMTRIKDSYYDEDVFLKMKNSKDPGVAETVTKIEHPGIENLRRTMNSTMDMLQYIKKIASGKMQLSDLPTELCEHMGTSSPNESERSPRDVTMRGVVGAGVGRSGRGTLLRTLVLVFLATFLWLQLHVVSLTGRETSGQLSPNETLFALVPRELHRFLKERRNSSSLSANASAGALTDLEIDEIRRNIERVNEEQKVFNEEAFGPLAADAPVIVIQVHARLTYLRHLIVSLAQAKGIEQALLVFSHDVWHPDINYLVQSVDFCRVMQIFYPHSIQTHPRTFPGEDPNDCPRNIHKEQALNLKCINAKHPDLYGHYREAKFTQTKHHWWWKANRVFDQLTVTRNHTGMVLFLEEDHYVAEDFLHVLRLMERTCRHSCERCNVLSLGTYLKTYNYFADFSRKFLGVNGALQKELLRGLKRHETIGSTARRPDGDGSGAEQAAGAGNGGNADGGGSAGHQGGQQSGAAAAAAAPAWAFQLLPSLYHHYQKAEVTPWISSKHNMGMAFNRATWNKLRKCAAQFCSYDDYNWDWSLQHVAQTCLPPSRGAGAAPRVDSGLIAMMMRAPRVFHIGECGVHHKKNNCESTTVIAKVQNVLRAARNHLFPSQLTLTVAGTAKKTKLRKGNGGWGDIRDHKLCWNITVNPDLTLP